MCGAGRWGQDVPPHLWQHRAGTALWRAGPPREGCTHTCCAVAEERKSRSSPSAAFSVSLFAQSWVPSLTKLCHAMGHPVPTPLHHPRQPWVQRGPRLLQQQQNPHLQRTPRLQPHSPAPCPCLQPPACLRGSTQGRAASHTATRHTQGVQTPPFSCHTPSQQETAPEALQRPISEEADRPFSSSPPLWAGKGTEPTHSAAPRAWPHSCLPMLLPARLMPLGFPFTLEQFPKLPGLRAARFWPWERRESCHLLPLG